MSPLRSKCIGLLLTLLLATIVAHTQVLVKSSADRETILVGESLKVTIEARLPLGEKVNWLFLDSIPHFEWIEKGAPNETDGIDGKKIEHVFTVTSYDTGAWVIPSFTIKVSNKSYSSEPVTIRVNYSDGFNSQEEYRDIKETIDVKTIKTDTLRWLIYAAAALILVIILYFFLRRKKPKKIDKPVRTQSPYDEAMQKLAQLQKDNTADDADIKLFYTKMNDIFREFLSKQFQLSTLEKTNEEVLADLRKLNLPAEEYKKTAESLRIADFVKFAKYKPGRGDNAAALTTIETTIKILHKPG
ncbi:MAG: hypothetical protein H7Y31_05620 [Chitinophagaceae bacterium]|nr:hypothetical protein [Chitinophagaceae bacterium]